MTYQNSGIQPIRSYKGALARYEGITHIRGRNEDQRPLGHRRKIDHFRISKCANGDIQCILYQTPVLTFTTDDNIVINIGGWPSSSTCKFINEVVGHEIYARVYDSSIVLRLNNKDYGLLKNTPTMLTRDRQESGASAFTIDQFQKRTRHMINRAGKAEVFKRYAACTDYLRGFQKLRRGVGVEQYEIRQALSADITFIPYPIDANYHLEHMHHLAMWAASTGDACHEDFYKLAVYLTTTSGVVRFPLYEEVIMGLNRDKVFVESEVPDGEFVRDAYKKYFSQGWDEYHAKHPQNV